MNGYERINAALKGEKTDKVPIMLHNFMMAAREYGVTMEQFRNNPKVIAGAFIKSVETYQFDGVLVDIDTVSLAGALGVKIDFPVNDPARMHDGILTELEYVRQLKPCRIEDYKYIQVWLEAVRLLKEYFKDEIYIRGNCDQAPFALATMVRGAQDLMMDLMMAEENLVFELLNYCTDATCQFIKLMAQTGADMVSNGDSPAGPEMISPEMYRMYAVPYEKQVVDEAHRNKLPYTLHICGNTDTIMENMLETGADALELDYKTNVQLAFDTLKDKACFIGNIDPSGVLALGTPELVEKKTIELLTIFSKTNRFILNAGCALPPNTPTGNLRLMIETAREFVF